MSFADRLRAAQAFDPRRFLLFAVAGQHCGWIRHDFAQHLKRWPDVFIVTAETVTLVDKLDTSEIRSAAIAPILISLRDAGVIAGWRDESYLVAAEFGGPPLFTIERAAALAFGIRTRGAHLNGTVGRGADCRMWIARRAANKAIDPSLLDNLVGGGVGLGFNPLQTIVKECDEEAGLSPELAERVQARSTVIMRHEVPQGMHWEMLHTFDLELEEAFVPRNRDGEVAEFRLLPIADVRRLVRDTNEFTLDAALVVIDFLFRHGLAEVERA